MADMISFHMYEDVVATFGSSEGIPDAYALCEAIADCSESHPFLPLGMRSKIWVAKDHYEDLEPEPSFVSPIDQSAFYPVSCLVVSFYFCVTLLHEIGHALTNAGLGSAGLKVCYMDCTVAEAGHELEAQLFGYTISPLDADEAFLMDQTTATSDGVESRTILKMLVANHWPSRHRVAPSLEEGYKIWAGGPLRNYELDGVVSRQWIVDLFTNQFWLGEDANESRRIVPSILGTYLAQASEEDRSSLRGTPQFSLESSVYLNDMADI